MKEYKQIFSGENFSHSADSPESMDSFQQDHSQDQNPFDRFMHNSNLDMLEAALPYVGSNMRKPLALYIKSMEVHRILHDLDREDILTACGFERRPPNPEAMLQAMKMAAGNHANPQLDQMLNMMNMMKSYQAFNEMMKNNPEMANFISGIMNQSQGKDLSSMAAQIFNQNMNQNMSQNINPDMMSLLSQNMNSDMMSLLSQNMNPDMMSVLSQLMNNMDSSR